MHDMSGKTDLIIIARAKAMPGKEKDLERALRDVAGLTRAQPGCVSFTVLRGAQDPAVMIGFERWESNEAHDRHLQGAHVQKFLSAVADVLAEPPDIVAYEIVDGAEK
ncbi:MAG TPA: putative quinol monooxygenase [Spirochaetia bacterium]|nr:putative quinol monooxygenase [Spirochaetia bacterium]